MISARQIAKRVLSPKVVDWLRIRVKASRAAKSAQARNGTVRPRVSGPTVDYVIGLEVRLWSTGNPTYAERLARVVSVVPRGSRPRVRGSIALARWEFSRARSDVALERLDRAGTADASEQRELDLLRVDCLCALGRPQAALSVLSRMVGRSTNDHNLLLRVGHARSLLEESRDHGSGSVTESLNALYHGRQLGMIRRKDVNEPVGFDNIVVEVPDAEPRETLPLVTVVTWLPESSDAGYGGLSSLLNQSWTNLEILVLDRPGGGQYRANLETAFAEDERVVFIECDFDVDRPWATAVDRATGELFTTHSYDSWEHPQRVEIQATALGAEPSLRGTVSSHMNVERDLTPQSLGLIPRQALVGPNPRSTMVRVSNLEPEDVVEAYDRVVASYSPVTGDLRPPQDVAFVREEVPLTLSLATRRQIPADEAVQV